MIDNSVLESQKMQLISMIAQLYDKDILDAIENLILNRDKDWWDTISDAEKEAIDQGLDDIANGRLTSHEEVMKEIDDRYGI